MRRRPRSRDHASTGRVGGGSQQGCRREPDPEHRGETKQPSEGPHPIIVDKARAGRGRARGRLRAPATPPIIRLVVPIPIPASLVRHLREGRCTLFVGAGLSAGAGLPGWGRLLDVMVTEVESEDTGASGPELRRLLAAGKLLDVADHCRQRLGERRYYELLGEQLRGGSGEIPTAHALITRLPFSAIVTTNYDKLLERAYTRVRGDLPKVVTASDRDSLGSLLFSGGFFILKAHGDIDAPASLVLTARDYREIIHANRAFDALFSALLMTQSVLFVGYSLSDPDFRLLMDRQLSTFGENIPERYAVMSDVGPVEADVLKRAANIKVLPYPAGEHGEVTTFLETLVQRLGPTAAVGTAEAAAAQPAAAAPPAPTPRAPTAAPRTPAPAGESLESLAPPPAGAAPQTRPPGAGNASTRSDGPPTAPEATLVITTRGDRLEALLRSEAGQTLHQSDAMAWGRFYQRLATLIGPGVTADRSRDDLRRAGARLAALLPADAITALPPETVLTIEAEGELTCVPWELALCDGQHALAMTRPMTRAFLADSTAARGLPGLRRPLRSLVIGDPGTRPLVRLPGAYDEAVAIARMYADAFGPGQCTLLCRDDATLDRVLDVLETGAFDVVHFAGHAWLDAHESFLAFDDDEMLTASELRTLLGRRPPALLFLNSHYTAFLPHGMRPVELREAPGVDLPPPSHRGFTQAAAASGVGAFIGCFSSPGDASAMQFGTAVHLDVLAGLPLATAVLRARRHTLSTDPVDASALQYVLAGHPHYRLT